MMHTPAASWADACISHHVLLLVFDGHCIDLKVCHSLQVDLGFAQITDALMRVLQVLSSTLQARIRDNYPSLLKDGLCDWWPSGFSSAVCQLATTAQTKGADLLGKGTQSVR